MYLSLEQQQKLGNLMLEPKQFSCFSQWDLLSLEYHKTIGFTFGIYIGVFSILNPIDSLTSSVTPVPD